MDRGSMTLLILLEQPECSQESLPAVTTIIHGILQDHLVWLGLFCDGFNRTSKRGFRVWSGGTAAYGSCKALFLSPMFFNTYVKLLGDLGWVATNMQMDTKLESLLPADFREDRETKQEPGGSFWGRRLDPGTGVSPVLTRAAFLLNVCSLGVTLAQGFHRGHLFIQQESWGQRHPQATNLYQLSLVIQPQLFLGRNDHSDARSSNMQIGLLQCVLYKIVLEEYWTTVGTECCTQNVHWNES